MPPSQLVLRVGFQFVVPLLFSPHPTSCFALFQLFLLVSSSLSDRSQQRALFSCPLDQVVLRVRSQLLAPPFIPAPHTSCISLFQMFLLVRHQSQIGPPKNVLFSGPQSQAVLRVWSQLGAPFLLLPPRHFPPCTVPTLPAGLVGTAQIGPIKETYFLPPR